MSEAQKKRPGSRNVFHELKRRNVVRVAAAYLVFAWVLLQVMEIMAPLLAIGDTTQRLAVAVLAIGFVPALAFSWFYQLTPEGFKRESDLGHSESTTGRKARKLEYITIVGALALVTMLLLRLQTAEEVSVDEPAVATDQVFDPPAHSIAVLPFTNMSGNPDNEYFSDGLADTVLHRLAQVEALEVIARTSSFKYRGTDLDIRNIGRELGVGAVLEGSVQQMGGQMRIIAQLINARDGTHLWSSTYDAVAENLFTVQDEISLQVAEALEIELLKEVTDLLTSSGTSNLEAHDLYTRGVYYADKFTPEGVRLAYDYFTQAVELDQGFVNAWVGMADALLRSPEFEHVPGSALVETINAFVQRSFPELDNEQRYQKARIALDTALSLDDSSATAWAALGYLETWLGDRKAAETAFLKALEYQADFASARYRYAKFLADEYRYGEATEQYEAALKLDPVNVPVIYWTFWYARLQENGFDRAVQLINRLVEQDPEYTFRDFRRPSMYNTISLFYLENGLVDTAVEWLEKELEFVPTRSVNIMQIASYYATLGDVETALRWRDHARQIPGIFNNRNANLYDWSVSMSSTDPEQNREVLARLFGDADIPDAWVIRAWGEYYYGNFDLALEHYDNLRGTNGYATLLWPELLISNYPILGPLHYADTLIRAGRTAEAGILIERSESEVRSLRQQGWISSNLDVTDAYMATLRGEHDMALEALERAMDKGALYLIFPTNPIFRNLHDNPRFHAFVERYNTRNAEQLALLKERHRIPPPWSPDY